MAQAGYTPIQLYFSTTAAAVPTSGNLANGELAINITDGKLYYKNNSGVVTLLAGATAGPAGGSNTQVQFNSSGVLAGDADLTFDGTTLTANALTVTNAVTLSGGTANGVPYLNGSKVLTSGSALTFSGQQFAISSLGDQIKISNSFGGTQQLTISSNAAGSVFTSHDGTSFVPIVWQSNTVEQMRLTSTGLGIGTSSPAGLLDVSGATPALTASQSSITVTAGTLMGAFNAYSRDSSTTSTGGVGGIRVYAPADYNTSNTPSYMAFFTHNTSPNDGTLLGNPTEQMRLDKDGNLGIGTSTTTGAKLTVVGGALTVGDEGTYSARFGNNSLKGVVIGYDTTNNVGHIGSINPAVAWTDLVINANGGNLGLGVTPSAWFALQRNLQLGGNFSGTAYAGALASQTNDAVTTLFNNAYINSSNVDTYYASASTAAAKYQMFRGDHRWFIAPTGTAGNAITFTQAMTLDSANGSLLVGTTSANGKLAVQSAGGSGVFSIYTNASNIANPNSSGSEIIGAQVTVGGNIILSERQPNGAFSDRTDLVFRTNTGFGLGQSDKMRLDSGGNLGIGNSSAVGRLEVYQNNNSGIPAIYARQDGTAPIQSWHVAGGTERARITSGGNFGIGTSNPSTLLSVHGPAGSFRQLELKGGSGNQILYSGAVADAVGSYTQNNAYYDNAFNFMPVTTGSSGTHYDPDGSMWFSTNSGLTIGTAFIPSERMRISTTGNMGIGTNSPGQRLDVNGNIRARDGAIVLSVGTAQQGIFCTYNQVFGSGTDYSPTIFSETGLGITFAVNGSATKAMTLDTSGRLLLGTTVAGSGGIGATIYSPSQSEIRLQNSTTGTGVGAGFQMAIDSVSGYLWNINSGIIFGTSSIERARITSSGVLLIGTSSTYNSDSTTQISGNPPGNQVFSIRHTGASPNGIYILYSSASPNNTGNYFGLYTDNAGVRFEFRSNGGIANYQANDSNLSDRREKTNFSPAGSYLDKICAIPVQTFNYIDQNLEEDGGLTLGVVAQDVQAVAPELVMESNWAKKDEAPKMRLSIYQTDLQYALMKCIQEQQAIIESLKARLDAANL